MFNFLYVYVLLYGYVHISMDTQRGQENRVLDLWELELQVVVRAAWCKCRN